MSDYIKRAEPTNALKEIETKEHDDLISRADAVPLKQTDTLIIADALRYLAQDTERHLSDRTRADALRQQFLKYGASMCHSADAVQGEWVCKEREYNDCDGYYAHYWYECSVCGARPPKDTWKNEWHSPYCPSCGARMTPYKGGDTEELYTHEEVWGTGTERIRRIKGGDE